VLQGSMLVGMLVQCYKLAPILELYEFVKYTTILKVFKGFWIKQLVVLCSWIMWSMLFLKDLNHCNCQLHFIHFHSIFVFFWSICPIFIQILY